MTPRLDRGSTRASCAAVTAVRRTLLGLVPKVALSRLTGLATRLPIPGPVRPMFYGWFARRYDAALDEVDGDLRDYRSMFAFFQRPLRSGARPIERDADFVWPCDGKVVTAGKISGDRIPQVKGVDYGLEEFVGDPRLASSLAGGSQVTVYLAPGDYHRVHAPFDARIVGVRRIPGTLYPVNQPAVRAVPGLFVRNARVVFESLLDDGRPAAIVMVGALNVGHIYESVAVGQPVTRGDEVGRFGFGSTTVVIVGPGGTDLPPVGAETVVRMGRGVR
jgi:phosphatidylserine decarboxylase